MIAAKRWIVLVVVSDTWSVENGFLTPTLKVKRARIEAAVCEFDPLRDQGAAYARALSAAGVCARELACRGQIHNSLTSVDLILSAAAARGEIAESLRGFFQSPTPIS